MYARKAGAATSAASTVCWDESNGQSLLSLFWRVWFGVGRVGYFLSDSDDQSHHLSLNLKVPSGRPIGVVGRRVGKSEAAAQAAVAVHAAMAPEELRRRRRRCRRRGPIQKPARNSRLSLSLSLSPPTATTTTPSMTKNALAAEAAVSLNTSPPDRPPRRPSQTIRPYRGCEVTQPIARIARCQGGGRGGDPRRIRRPGRGPAARR